MSRPAGGAAPARGLRREAPLLLAVALLVFVALAGFTLLGYRSAVGRLASERAAEAAALADRAAREAQRTRASRVEPLAALVPPGGGLALFDDSGLLLDAVGYAEAPEPAPDTGGARATGLAPDASGRSTAVGWAGYEFGGARRRLRVDLPAGTLAGQLRSLRWLTPLVLALSAAAAVVTLLYVRALTRPYETLLARARAAGEVVGSESDELGALVATFDRALGALAARPGALDSLSSALGGELDGGFLLLDRDGRLLAATPAASELLGVAPPPLGEPVALALAERPDLVALLDEAVRSGRALPRGAVRVERDGAESTVGVTAEPLRGEGGRARGFLVVVADLTELERRAAQERLAEGLAQLGELSAGVAHELRNSLASLSGWLTLARRRLPPDGGRDAAADADDAGVEDCLAEAERETAQLARVVEDFLAFARPGTRRVERIDLAAVVRRAAQDPALGEIGVELDLARDAVLDGDPELLERAVRNLVANAAQAERAAGRRGPLAVSLAPADGDWRIAIEDRGAGLPTAVRERLFEPFVSGRPGGAGLGLALARRIVVLHGGAIRLGDRPGGGTCAEILLPPVVSVTEGSDSRPTPGA